MPRPSARRTRNWSRPGRLCRKPNRNSPQLKDGHRSAPAACFGTGGPGRGNAARRGGSSAAQGRGGGRHPARGRGRGSEEGGGEAEAKRQADQALAVAEAQRKQAEAEALPRRRRRRRRGDRLRKRRSARPRRRREPTPGRRGAGQGPGRAREGRGRGEDQGGRQGGGGQGGRRAGQAQGRGRGGRARPAPRTAERQRLQVALTSLGFDTRGNDGVFGPRSREMVAAWQKARNEPPTGFLTGTAASDYQGSRGGVVEVRRAEESGRHSASDRGICSAAGPPVGITDGLWRGDV